MNQSQNENKPLTRQEILDSIIDQEFSDIPKSIRCEFGRKRLNIQRVVALEAMTQYAAQQVKDAEENATWAHDQLQSVQEELLFYKDKYSKLKQVTEERDKAVDLVRRCFQSHDLPGRLWLDIRDFLNSLNAAKP